MKKKIVFIIPHLKNGGAERVVSNLLTGFSDESFEKYLIVYDGRRLDYPCNAKLVDLKLPEQKNPLRKLITGIRRYLAVRSMKKELDPHFTVSFLNNPNFLNSLTKYNDMTVLTVHSFMSKRVSGFYGAIYKFIIKIFYNKADIIIAVSEEIRSDLIKDFGIDGKKIRVIYNFVETERINELMHEKIEDRYRHIFEKKVIVNVGRPVEAKGQWHLIRAFSNVLKSIPDLNLVIIGEGELESYLKELIIEMGLENNVFLLGYQKNPFKFIAKSELYAMSSIYEGFPVTLVEAATCRIPVLSTNCRSGPSEVFGCGGEEKFSAKVVRTECGILTPVFDGKKRTTGEPLTDKEQIFSDEMKRMLDNPELSRLMAENLYERSKKFGRDKILNRWNDILEITK
jgi:glycosyltransferase involved in cell wall biosynthesis